MSNTFGTIFRLTTFGESHSAAIGGVVDGCPAGIKIDFEKIETAVQRRRPQSETWSTQRKEADRVIFLSGIKNGFTEGTPIAFIIKNTDVRPEDYADLAEVYRPNHADFTYRQKYNAFNDTDGGGRASARETAARVVGGAIASAVLQTLCPSLKIYAYTRSIGGVAIPADKKIDFSSVYCNAVRCPDETTTARMEAILEQIRHEGDSLGGSVGCVVQGCPPGLGQPVFDKLSARLASAMISIPAAKGFEIGDGFALTSQRGSEVVDTWIEAPEDARGIRTAQNHSGGIQGGISNGENIVFNVAFKPVATMMREIETTDINGRRTTVHPRGRHDVCVVPRAVPVVEAMTALVLADLFLIDSCCRV